jgi:hypothetical protein
MFLEMVDQASQKVSTPPTTEPAVRPTNSDNGHSAQPALS